MEDYKGKDENHHNEREEIYSKAVRAGKRTYFFDVKATKKNDYYITITESKRQITPDDKFYGDYVTFWTKSRVNVDFEL